MKAHPRDSGKENMSQSGEDSPDQPLGTETFEQGDEALDEESRLDPNFTEEVEQDPSLNPALQVDDRELEEAGVQLDDPERLASLDGGFDDPDGIDDPSRHTGARRDDDDGWNLDQTDISTNDPDATSEA
jgi:hypothetical protein